MSWRLNPFSDLYVTESLTGDEFVRLFSDKLVRETTNLFTQENTIIEGVQGSGKSMLLSLLRPEIRLAYSRQGKKFPVPGQFGKFFSAGINLTLSGAKDFYNLSSRRRPAEWEEEIPLLFGDYVNYQVVYSLIRTIEIYSRSEALSKSVGMNNEEELINSFFADLASLSVWFGVFDGVSSLAQFKAVVEERLKFYKRLLNLNERFLPDLIRNTKTTIGEPFFEFGRQIKKSGVLDNESSFVVFIDQYEELDHLTSDKESSLFSLRSILNKALHSRNKNAAIKIGTRGYSWKGNKFVYGSDAQIEKDRDYSLISISEMMRNQEARKSSLFQEFSQDVFCRRVKEAGLVCENSENDVMEYVLGRSLKKADKAALYQGSFPEKKIRVDENWPDEWVSGLKKFARDNILYAHLLAAYARQKGKSAVVNGFNFSGPMPWASYWENERIDAATIQIASNANESLRYFGKDDVVSISGGNVLAFLNICRAIWSTYIAATSENDVDPNALPHHIPRAIQSVAILDSSRAWYEKLSELPYGETRKAFIGRLGAFLHKAITGDLALSNPGYYGFSVAMDDLDKNPEMRSFLSNCVDYSSLVQKEHSTKNPGERLRIKYYLVNIMCPGFRLPHAHKKEPIYLSVKKLEDIKSGKPLEKNKYKQVQIG